MLSLFSPSVSRYSKTNSTEWSKCNEIGSTQYYWYYEALQISDSINDVGGFAWKITMCLLTAWVLVALCMWKGIQTTGKVRNSRRGVKTTLRLKYCKDATHHCWMRTSGKYWYV